MLGGLALSSCTKNDDNTIALIGTEYYIDDILSVIPDSLQAKFKNAFGDIPEGAIPDSIDGSYVVDSNVMVNNNQYIPTPSGNPKAYIRFSRQHNGIVVMDLYDGDGQTTDTVFVMGKEGRFTAYCIEDKVVEELNFMMKRGVVIRGKVSDEGLSDFRMAFIVMDVEGEGQGQAAAPGSYYIFKDNDGVAKRCEWPWQ